MTGLRRVQLYLKDCAGFDGYVYDSYTGWNTVSRIIIEEISPSECQFVITMCKIATVNLTMGYHRSLCNVITVLPYCCKSLC